MKCFIEWPAPKKNDSGCSRREANYEEKSAEVGWFWIKAYKLIICNTVEAFSFFFSWMHIICIQSASDSAIHSLHWHQQKCSRAFSLLAIYSISCILKGLSDGKRLYVPLFAKLRVEKLGKINLNGGVSANLILEDPMSMHGLKSMQFTGSLTLTCILIHFNSGVGS